MSQAAKLTELPKGTRLDVVTPADRSGGKTHWQTMGSAFVMGDGSLQIVLDGFPVNGKLQVRIPLPKKDA
ncbi:hypothetical protein [Corallococcus terminator]|uniref:Uncharacterized protein n=1 Tax=Corallococcus terminator TaxID=2316733 RepID=A0A3A8HSJ4_9BACT|nr:hypothetical protein [Corallococcus terminator]RKG68213.1 hypothetical protein D7V88_40770 [Corallococcus terminator]